MEREAKGIKMGKKILENGRSEGCFYNYANHYGIKRGKVRVRRYEGVGIFDDFYQKNEAFVLGDWFGGKSE